MILESARSLARCDIGADAAIGRTPAPLTVRPAMMAVGCFSAEPLCSSVRGINKLRHYGVNYGYFLYTRITELRA